MPGTADVRTLIQSTSGPAAVPQFAQPADGPHPAEALVDELPRLLTDGRVGVPSRARIDRDWDGQSSR